MSESKSGPINPSKPRLKSPPKAKRLYPYQPPSQDSRVAEPAVAYEIAPLETPIEETLALLSPLEQAEVLEVSSKTLTRWRNKGEHLTPQQTDRIAVLESIFKHGEDVLGSREAVSRWLHEPVFFLKGQRPIDLIKTERGRREVDNALGVIEWGMF